MTKYQEGFYKFVIAPDNFEAVCDIVENFEEIKELLIYGFWIEVKSKCEALLKKGWKVFLPPLTDNSEPEFTVYCNGFYTTDIEDEQEFSLAVGNVFGESIFGLYVAKETSVIDREQLYQIVKANKKAGWKSYTDYFYYKSLGEHFGDIASLRKLDPSNRASLVLQYASDIVNAVTELEPFVNKHILKVK